MMKRILLVSCLLVSAVLLIAVAGEKAFFGEPEGLPSGVRALDVTAPNPEQAANDAPALDMAALEAELEIISEQIVAQKQAGLEPDPGLYERLVEIERQLYPRPEGDALDQGSETCDAATVIDNTEPVAFCDTGIMGATDDCTLLGGAAYSGYRDVFYTFTPMHTGLYVVSTCGSVGDMYLKIWDSTCCAGNTAGFDDDSCGGLDSRRRLTLTEGVQYWFEVGYYSSSQAADVYNFNLFGPLPVPPEVPANDVCLTATPIASLPATISGTTYGSADETQAPTCGGTTQSYGGLYYTVVGTGNFITARTHNNCSTFNSRVRVYTGSCTALVCVGGNDDATPPGSTGLSSFTWCADPGVTYIIIVSNYHSSVNYRGPFTLEVFEGGPCACDQIPLCGTPTETEPNNSCATRDVREIGCNDSLFALHCVEADTDWFQIRIPPLTSMTIRVSEGANCSTYPLVALVHKVVGTSCTGTLSTSSTSERVITNNQAATDSLIFMMVYQTTPNARIPYKIVTSCVFPINCDDIVLCGEPAEVEPNNACADIANFLPVGACGERVYGKICRQTPLPQTGDVDYWYVPATTPPQMVTVLVKDGEGCNTWPPTGIGVKLAGTPTCTTPTGSAYGGFIFGGCQAWPGGYIAVVRVAGGPAAYALETTCSEVACPNVQLPNQHCAGPCVGPIATDYAWHSFPLVVPIEYHITDLNVRVDITHTYDGDLDMFLVTPWGDSLELSTDNGAGGDNFQVTVFDDEGANGPVTAGVAPFNGSYIPEELLAGADWFNAVGTWTLAIYDDAGGDHGYVNCWCLEFEYDYILAAELNGFDAVGRDGEVEVTWSTASETDNDHFELVRNGTMVASIEATNSATGSNYSWTDRDVTNGTTYTYTLVAVDINGGRSELATESATPTSNVAIITEYALHQNYPNPFNPETQITYDLVEAGNVTLTVYNLMGQEVATLVNGMKDAGRHNISFNASGLTSGLYLYKLEANGFTAQHKMLLLK